MGRAVTPTVVQQRARLLWLEGAPVEQIAAAAQVKPWVVYGWRARFNWPKRPDPRRGVVRPVVALAAALWDDDVPRPTIAALCQVTVKLVDCWKAKYGWRRRSPGIRSRPADISKPLLRRAKSLATKQAVVATPKVPLPQWVCCDQRLALPRCPTCHRPHPLAQ